MMKLLKQLSAGALALALAAGVTAGAEGAQSAVRPDPAAAVATLTGLRVLQGRTQEGDLALEAAVTRAEAATILYRAATGDVEGKGLTPPGADPFTDVSREDWHAAAIQWCVGRGLIGGYGDGAFGPNDTVTGAQLSAMLLRALGYDNGDSFTGAGWADSTARWGSLTGLTHGIGEEALDAPAPRGLTALLTHRAMTAVPAASPGGGNAMADTSLAERSFALAWEPELQALPANGLFYLLDATPRKQFDRYDEHTVLVSGRVSTVRTVKGLLDGAAPGLYRAEGLRGELISRVSPVTERLTDMTWSAEGVLSVTGGDWNRDGTGVDYTLPAGHIPLAEGCRVYRIRGGVVTPMEPDDLSGAAGWLVAEEGHGFPTLIYLEG